MIVPIRSRIATGYTSAPSTADMPRRRVFGFRRIMARSLRMTTNIARIPRTAQGTVPVDAGIGIETDWLSVYVPPNEGKPSSEPSVIRVKLHCAVTVT
jgi:hypothetical protein